MTDDLLDIAVAAGVAEANGLDSKAELPSARGLPQTRFAKDVAAMAHSGGGVIVCGVLKSHEAATERVNAGELDEANERLLRSGATTLSVSRLPFTATRPRNPGRGLSRSTLSSRRMPPRRRR